MEQTTIAIAQEHRDGFEALSLWAVICFLLIRHLFMRYVILRVLSHVSSGFWSDETDKN